MKFFTKNLGILYLLGGCFIGCFIGFKVLPTMLEPEVPSAEIVLATQNARENIERNLAATLMLSDNIAAARVHLTAFRLDRNLIRGSAAAVTLSFEAGGLRPDQLNTIAHQISGGVHGFGAGDVSIFDALGVQLNREEVASHGRVKFWKTIALNVTKVLGVLAALITLKFIIEAIGKGVESEKTC